MSLPFCYFEQLVDVLPLFSPVVAATEGLLLLIFIGFRFVSVTVFECVALAYGVRYKMLKCDKGGYQLMVFGSDWIMKTLAYTIG